MANFSIWKSGCLFPYFHAQKCTNAKPLWPQMLRLCLWHCPSWENRASFQSTSGFWTELHSMINHTFLPMQMSCVISFQNGVGWRCVPSFARNGGSCASPGGTWHRCYLRLLLFTWSVSNYSLNSQVRPSVFTSCNVSLPPLASHNTRQRLVDIFVQVSLLHKSWLRAPFH